jgi:phenylacetate-CoA ligase
MDEYGCAELQAIAYECPAGRRHITHENVLVEVLGESGVPLPPGQPGPLTLTSLCNVAMPLIRYQNGDVAELEAEGRCPCGRHLGLPLVKRIVGRSCDVLYRAHGQRSHCGAVYYAINEAFEPGMLVEYQARQKSYGLIERSVARGPRYDDEAMARFQQRLQDLLGHALELEVTFVEEIARERSGKMSYFVSDIPGARLGESSRR